MCKLITPTDQRLLLANPSFSKPRQNSPPLRLGSPGEIIIGRVPHSFQQPYSYLLAHGAIGADGCAHCAKKHAVRATAPRAMPHLVRALRAQKNNEDNGCAKAREALAAASRRASIADLSLRDMPGWRPCCRPFCTACLVSRFLCAEQFTCRTWSIIRLDATRDLRHSFKATDTETGSTNLGRVCVCPARPCGHASSRAMCSVGHLLERRITKRLYTRFGRR